MTFIQRLDGTGQPMVIPVLAITAASLDVRSDEADELLDGLELLGSAEIAALKGAEQAARLAAVIARTGLDPWDAHVAAVADAAICPILALDGAKWRQYAERLDEPLHIIEIADPDQAPEEELGTESSIACRAGTSSSAQPIWRTISSGGIS